MLLTSNVPKEIVDALEHSTFSLHIKGDAGSGKTTMALEIIRMIKGSAVYLSTRVSPSKLYKQFPWSEPCLHKENILDANTSLDHQTREETLFEYVDRPSFLRNLYSRILEVKEDHIAIIVDSIDALKSNLRIPKDDLNTERDVLDMAERVDANTIFISEATEESELDHLVDGVVRLKKEIWNERLLRKLYIEKVRRTKIENPTYLFTLKEGRFKCFDTGLSINFVQKEFPKIEEKKRLKIPTLIPELDEILAGGYERGTFNIFDIGENVGMFHAYILSSIFLNFVIQKLPVFSIPSKGIFSIDVFRNGVQTYLGNAFMSSLGENAVNSMSKYFHVIFPPSGKFMRKIETYDAAYLKGEDFLEDIHEFMNLATRVLDDTKADTLFVIMASDTMEYIYGSDKTTKIIQTWMDKIRQLNGIFIILNFEHGSLKRPTHFVTTHFKLENIGGNIVLYGEIPKTKMYVSGLDILKGYVQPSFTPLE